MLISQYMLWYVLSGCQTKYSSLFFAAVGTRRVYEGLFPHTCYHLILAKSLRLLAFSS